MWFMPHLPIGQMWHTREQKKAEDPKRQSAQKRQKAPKKEK